MQDVATLWGGTSGATGTLTFHLYADDGSGGCGTEVTPGSPVTKAVSGAAGTSATDGTSYSQPAVAVRGAGVSHVRVSYSRVSTHNNSDIALTACGQSADHELSHVG